MSHSPNTETGHSAAHAASDKAMRLALIATWLPMPTIFACLAAHDVLVNSQARGSRRVAGY
jgi:hypothetical protein